MLELGKAGKKEHFNVGKKIYSLGLRNLYTYGNLSYNIYRGARGVKNNFYFKDKQTLIELLKTRLRKNDLVLVKASRVARLERVVEALRTGLAGHAGRGDPDDAAVAGTKGETA